MTVASETRVARWFYCFIPKIRILAYFGMLWNGHLEFLLPLWYILLPFGAFIAIILVYF
jgi:hypothetical protein